MSDARTFVIVGASLAGAKAAQTLREEGFDGEGRPRWATNRCGPTSGHRSRRSTCRARRGSTRSSSTTRATTRSTTSVSGRRRMCGRSTPTGSAGRALVRGAASTTTRRSGDGAAPRRLTVPGSDLPGVLTCGPWRIRSPADRHTPGRSGRRHRRRMDRLRGGCVGPSARRRRSPWWRPARCPSSVCRARARYLLPRRPHRARRGVAFRAPAWRSCAGPAGSRRSAWPTAASYRATCSSSAWA